RGAPAPLAGDDLKPVVRPLHGADHQRLDHAVLLDRGGELGEFAFRKRSARVARIRLQKLDRHLALRARPIDMRRLAADIADQTCKTAAQSRTRFIGHRRKLPWIHSTYSGIQFRDRRVGKAQRSPSSLNRGWVSLGSTHPTDHRQLAAFISRSRWITSVASFR